MPRLNPEATYDCLFIAQCLQSTARSFAIPEIHLFAYLSCLLWLYRKYAVTDWGYSFMGTELGAPFSLEIDKTIDCLLESGFVLRSDNRLQITILAEKYVNDFSQLTINKDRTECLRAACESTFAFSVGMVSSAMSQEPELSRAKSMPLDRYLLEEPALYQLYQQFDMLKEVLNQRSEDLRVPAVVWIEALYRANEAFEARP